MLNPFPIQWLALLAYFILRAIVGSALIWLGLRHFQERNPIATATNLPLFPFPKTAVILLALTELIAGSLLLLGFYTQIGALILVVLSLKMLVWNSCFSHPAIPSRLTYLLLLGCGLSLFITGGGAFAFDLPI